MFDIAGRLIGQGEPPYVIAEVSGNHNNDINRAFKMIELAALAGADAVKFQAYTADSLTIKTNDKAFELSGGTWAGKHLYELYEEAATPWHWFPKLFEKSKEYGITAFSSVFDIKSLDLLENLDVPAYKIASNEFIDMKLIQEVAKTGKPIILSTGCASKSEVREVYDFIYSLGNKNIALLHCTSEYPADLTNADLLTLIDIESEFDCVMGFSDHTLGITAPIVATALGAKIIEKHFTLSRDDGGPDSSFSLEPSELTEMCSQIALASKALGEIKYGGEKASQNKQIYERQLWSIAKINEGEVLSDFNFRSIRAPTMSGAISAKSYFEILGKKVTNILSKDTPIRWKDLEND